MKQIPKLAVPHDIQTHGPLICGAMLLSGFAYKDPALSNLATALLLFALMSSKQIRNPFNLPSWIRYLRYVGTVCGLLFLLFILAGYLAERALVAN